LVSFGLLIDSRRYWVILEEEIAKEIKVEIIFDEIE